MFDFETGKWEAPPPGIAPDAGGGEAQEVAGVLSRIRFQRDAFLIAEVEEDAGERGGIPCMVAVKGGCLSPQVGARYVFRGRWTVDGKFGKTFVFSDYEVALPTSQEGVRRYLIEQRWIGPATASAIVRAYGGDALEILKADPARVAREVPGINAERAAEISEALIANEAQEKLLVGLNDLFAGTGIPKAAVRQMLAKWKRHALEIVRENPFAMTEFHGVGFLLADKVRERVGIPHDDPNRMRAGVLHVLKEAAWGDGHAFLPEPAFVDASTRALRVRAEAVTETVRRMHEAGEVFADLMPPGSPPMSGRWRVALRELRAAEEAIAAHVHAAMRWTDPEKGDPEPALEGLAGDQVEAVSMAVKSRVFVMTGAPGVGKTHAIRRLVESFPRDRIVLCAPTGKAAKRVMEQTGMAASTIHRLLEPAPTRGGGFEFSRNRHRKLEADLAVVDEGSMVDVVLMAALVDALPVSCRLVVVGDVHQLASVGPGAVLRDMIESGAVPCVELTEIKRQEPGGMIVPNCHLIKAGRPPAIDNAASKDFFFVDEESEGAAFATVVDLVARRLPAHYGVDPARDVQVLVPLREKGDLSCRAFNAELRKAVNPAAAADASGRKFFSGDKVIQTKNDYQIGIFNGDMGFVQGFDEDEKAWDVKFEDPEREVSVPAANNDLDLAYALTVHKFQGSEAPIVVLPIHESQGRMVTQRSWIYTAISRARRVCVVVGQRTEVAKIVRRVERQRRWTALRGFLSDPASAPPPPA